MQGFDSPTGHHEKQIRTKKFGFAFLFLILLKFSSNFLQCFLFGRCMIDYIYRYSRGFLRIFGIRCDLQNLPADRYRIFFVLHSFQIFRQYVHNLHPSCKYLTNCSLIGAISVSCSSPILITWDMDGSFIFPSVNTRILLIPSSSPVGIMYVPSFSRSK